MRILILTAIAVAAKFSGPKLHESQQKANEWQYCSKSKILVFAKVNACVPVLKGKPMLCNLTNSVFIKRNGTSMDVKANDSYCGKVKYVIYETMCLQIQPGEYHLLGGTMGYYNDNNAIFHGRCNLVMKNDEEVRRLLYRPACGNVSRGVCRKKNRPMTSKMM